MGPLDLKWVSDGRWWCPCGPNPALPRLPSASQLHPIVREYSDVFVFPEKRAVPSQKGIAPSTRGHPSPKEKTLSEQTMELTR